MRKLKYFESFDELAFDIDDLYWTKATISLSILRGNDVTDFKRNVFDDKLTYEVIDKFDIDVEDSFNFTTIEDKINDMRISDYSNRISTSS